MWKSRTPQFDTRLLYTGILLLSLAIVSSILFVASISNPWLTGVQCEPYYSWAIGSGRLKIWIAELGPYSSKISAELLWTSSWYRGLDGQPIRWDFTFSNGSTGGIVVIAIPLWTIIAVSGTAGSSLTCASILSRRFDVRDEQILPNHL